LKVLKNYDRNAFLDNISKLKIDYFTNYRGGQVNSADPNQCYPIWKLNNKEIRCLINAYPKEWLVNEIERDELLKYDLADIRSFEPWWKLILGNKALLPLLWSMYPGHENLLPSYYDANSK